MYVVHTERTENGGFFVCWETSFGIFYLRRDLKGDFGMRFEINKIKIVILKTKLTGKFTMNQNLLKFI